ncbi:acetyltransferase (GNAT) family protein [Anaeroplasma bactoclasticum]|uniref:Acetyltransferase (GNAT) family protein n=2 Tax=Anaeroplasma bactoclasticum TaxID=2088 RepID=A0A397QVG5_9MOLU|nr:acetyltransferase (GNAT) family protein [Anaeroplasma bactoclasticum]
MIKILKDIEEYVFFINKINKTDNYSDPMLSNEVQMKHNLLESVNKKDNITFGIFDHNNIIIGFFVFLVIEEEKYAEMIVGLSDNKKAYFELFEYLFDNYKAYNIDFVYNPNNNYLNELLKEYNASFEIEQQKMQLIKFNNIKRKNEVILYSPKYKEQYINLHLKDTYWTGEKVLTAFDKFRVILAIKDNKVVGYVDITHKYEENEPYDVFVKEEYRNMGIATDMLSYAIELDKNKRIMLLVDIDNEKAIKLYEKLGFEKVKGNNITAHLYIEWVYI